LPKYICKNARYNEKSVVVYVANKGAIPWNKRKGEPKMAKKITVINAISESIHTQLQQRLKVCAYARVSTGSRAQAESYATQVEYYAEKIEGNPLWEFAGVYADEGITGTKVKGRDDFKAMVAV